MVGRVQLSRNGIRVSKPGIEVATASVNNLLLNISQRQGQILLHGYMAATPRTGSQGEGPWDASASFGPFSAVPDLTMAIVVAGNRQMAMPVFRSSEGLFSAYSFSNTQLTANSLSVTILSQGSPNGQLPDNVIGVTYLLFRKPDIST